AHDGSNTTTDAFTFTVVDPAGNSTPATDLALTITPVDDDAPVVGNHAATLSEGQTLVLAPAHLSATDADSDDAALQFTISAAPAHGTLSLNGVALAAGQSFTQAQLVAGDVRYAHDGSNTTTDAFTFTVVDPAGNSTPATDLALTITPGGVSGSLEQFDFGNATSPVATGFTAVIGEVFDVARGYGWAQPAGTFTRNGADALLTDGNFGQDNTFLVNVVGRQHVTLTLGDESFARDQVRIWAEGAVVAPLVTTTPGEFAIVEFDVDVADGQLALRFEDVGGAPYFTLNGLTLRPAVDVQPITLQPAGPFVADGLTIDTLSGSGAPPNALVTIATKAGTVLDDVASQYDGVQVQADATGQFSARVRRPLTAGAATVTASAINGAAEGALEITYLAPTSYHIDLNTAGSPTQPGYLELLPTTLHTASSPIGWDIAVSAFDRGGASGPLIQDGHYASGARVLRVNVPANQTYLVSLTLGDASARRDHMAVRVNGVDVSGDVSTSAGEFARVTGFATVDDAGLIEIAIEDLAGDLYWVLNGVDIVRADELEPVTFTRLSDQPLSADGATVDTITGSVNLPDGTLLTVTTTQGVILSDTSPAYQGAQVPVTNGSFSFQLRRPAIDATPEFSATALTGEAYGAASDIVSYEGVTTRRFDFNRHSNDTEPGFTSVRAGQIYNDTTGHGWQSSPFEFERGTAGYSVNTVSLHRDGAWGSAGATGAKTFVVSVLPGSASDVLVHVGDRNFARDQIQVQTEDGQVAIAPNTAANQFTAVQLFHVVDDGDGRLEITFSDLGGTDAYWVVNGLEISASGNAARPAPLSSSSTSASPALGASTASAGVSDSDSAPAVPQLPAVQRKKEREETDAFFAVFGEQDDPIDLL
ncbi:MAG: hypothetical protein KDB14_15055, partial [Planctomycetales bacterium]|nr:hypothetical protein [Planctomycetales bacterium]